MKIDLAGTKFDDLVATGAGVPQLSDLTNEAGQ